MKLFNFAFVLSFSLVRAYLVTPPGAAAPGSDVDCSEWVQQSYSLTCAIIEEFYGLTAAEFEAWNPSTLDFGTNCTLIDNLYYCVQINFVPMSTLNPAPPTSSTTSSSSTSSTLVTSTTTTSSSSKSSTSSTILTTTTSTKTTSTPTSTTSTKSTTTTTSTTTGDGISTPTPYQTGMATNCNKFHLVVSGDSCSTVASNAGISLTQFYAWNPAVGSTCEYLDLGDYVCIDIIGVTPTTTSNDGVTTPTPIQTGMTTKCESFHLVVSGDSCDTISANAGVSLNDFYLWNPAVGSSCSFLDVGDYVCIGILPITTCTSATVLAAPTQYASTCGAPGFSNDGSTSLLLVSYTSGANVASAGACGAACLANTACTNLYFIEGAYCNLHEEASTYFESTASGYYSWFEADCFSTGEACGSLGFSGGNGLITSYTTGTHVASAGACGAICLATATCTNVYFVEGSYCNLHSGEYTFSESTASGYYAWYQYDCFTC